MIERVELSVSSDGRLITDAKLEFELVSLFCSVSSSCSDPVGGGVSCDESRLSCAFAGSGA